MLRYFDEVLLNYNFPINLFKIDENFLSLFESKYRIKLALAHKELLLQIGLNAGSSFYRSEYNFNEYDKILEVIEECFGWKLDFKDGYFPFTVVTDPIVIFTCYRLDEGDNPPIYRCSEVDKVYKKVYDSFTEFYYEQKKHILKMPPNGLR